jgi:hypothetical protein
MAWTKFQRDEVTVRRTELLKLRRQGVRYDDDRIAALDYSSPEAARKDLTRTLQAHRDAEAAVFRQQENERLDELLEAAWPAATTPKPIRNKEGDIVGEEIDMRAIDTVLRLMDRRAKLNGLDMPVKAEVTGADGGPLSMTPASLTELKNIMQAGATSGDGDSETRTPTARNPTPGEHSPGPAGRIPRPPRTAAPRHPPSRRSGPPRPARRRRTRHGHGPLPRRTRRRPHRRPRETGPAPRPHRPRLPADRSRRANAGNDHHAAAARCRSYLSSVVPAHPCSLLMPCPHFSSVISSAR